MKKHKNKGLFLVVTFIFMAFSIFHVKDVFAAEIDYDARAKELCKSKLENRKVEWDESKKKLSSDQSQLTVYIKSKDGQQYTFDVGVDYTIGDTTTHQDFTNQTTDHEITIPTKYDGKSNVIVKITATLVSSTQVTDTDGVTYDCSRNFVLESSYRFEDNSIEKVANPSFNGICARYKSGTLSNSDLKLNNNFKELTAGGKYSYATVSSKTINGQSGASLLSNLFPYCDSQYVDNVYSDRQVLNQLYQAAGIVINRANFQENALPNSENEGFVKLDPSRKISLTCDAFAVNTESTRKSNVRKFYFTSSDKKSMDFHYTPNTTETKDVCSVECVEQVTVSYGPPVSVKAGLCFEYEVEIRSKVTCSSKLLTEEPKISQYKVCEPTAYCNNSGSYYFDQAGPNEEFDSCVNSCDGGKYSQSCINSCYNKVYKKKKSSKKKTASLALNSSSVMKLANSNPSWCNENNLAQIGDGERRDNDGNVQYPSNQAIGKASTIAAAYRNSVYGGYYYSNGKVTLDGIEQPNISWKTYDASFSNSSTRKLADGTVVPAYPGCYWNGYGRYYFLNTTKGIRTVFNDNHIRIHYYDGNDKLGDWLYFPSNGFKSSSACNDKCHWEIGTCDGYLNYVSPNGTSSAYNAYYKDLKKYNETLEECSAKAKCSETTATYTMTANNSINIKTCTVDEGKGNDGSNGSCTTWEETSDKKTSITTDSKNNIITKEVSGVCALTPTTDNDDYKTVISFPGSYINNKTGDVVFKVPTGKEKYYSYKKNQYCVPLNAKDVNKNWYIWDQVNKRAESAKSSVNTTLTTDTTGTTYNKYTDSNAIYNIGATIKKFGFLDWNVDVSCFYAVSTVSDTPSGDGDECRGTNCKKTSATNYDTKAAALDELFPAADTTDNAVGTSTTTELKESAKVTKLNYMTKKSSATKVANSSTSRDVGYNWSCDSTNLTNKNYPVTPTALISKIQKQGDSIYNDSTEKDFHLTITKQNIKNIRSYNKDKAYTDFGTDKYVNNVNNISFYKSSFLKNTSYVYSYSGPRVHLCNNMKNGECDVLSEYVSSEQACVKLNNEKVGVTLYE